MTVPELKQLSEEVRWQAELMHATARLGGEGGSKQLSVFCATGSRCSICHGRTLGSRAHPFQHTLQLCSLGSNAAGGHEVLDLVWWS